MIEGNWHHTLSDETYLGQWQSEYDRLHTAGEDIAGLFRGVKPNTFGANNSAKVLYVGKATSGPFNESDVYKRAYNGSHAFWVFARRLAWTLDCSVEECIAWTNISKLSRNRVAADKSLLVGMGSLVTDTLEAEIAATDPEVIVFVTHHFCDEAVRTVAEGEADSDWSKSEIETSGKIIDVWWKLRQDGRAVLWMEHPQGASEEKLAYAAEKIAMLRDNVASLPYHALS